MSLKHSVILLVVLFFLFGMTTKSKLVGYWELYKIEKLSNSRTKERRGKFIDFHQNGELTGGRIGKSANKSGSWELNKKAKTVTLITPDHPSDGGDYTIVKLSKKSLILYKDSTKIYFDKGLK